MNDLTTILTRTVPLWAMPTRDEEEFVTELRHLPEGWIALGGIVLLAAICWLVVWMYRREGRAGASPGVRTFLAIVRCLVWISLAAILLEPVRVRILRKWIDSYTVVMVDDSSSMDLTDNYRDATAADRVRRITGSDMGGAARRTELVTSVLGRENREFVRQLAQRNRVKIYSFSDRAQVVGTVRAAWERTSETSDENPTSQLSTVDAIPLRFAATGPSTNLERSMRRAIESLGSAPIAGVVVIGDGGFNQGASVVDVGRYAFDRRLPVHTIGIGDPSPPRNVRVAEVSAAPNVFQDDPFPITARVTAEGMDQEMVEVRLWERDANRSGEGRVVETKQVRVGIGGAIDTITFLRHQEKVGRYVYTVEIPVMESETVEQDNRMSTTVNVIDARTRVLLISGGPSWEYRYLSRLLQRDETFDVSCWLQSADLSAVRDGNTIIDHLPTRPEELFVYDLIILMDPDKKEFDAQWCRVVDRFVTQQGGGLLVTAARTHTPDFMRERSLKPLHDLLPIALDPEADLVLNRVGHYQLSAFPIDVPSEAAGHDIMKLADNVASSRLLWRSFGEVYWHYPVRREKPAATVLMRHTDPTMRNAFGGHVLAATQFVGAGRTAFLAFDGTWRWRRHGIHRFDRFWVQLTRYLVESKLLAGSKRGMILTQGDRFSIGEAITVNARLFDSRFEPLQRDEVRATVTVDGEQRELSLSSHPDRPGWFEGRFVPDRTGNYRILLRLPGAGSTESSEVVHDITVTRPNIEIVRPQMDRRALMTLSEKSAGGRYFEIDEAHELPEIIPDLHAEIPIRSRPTTLWDHWVTLTILVFLLSLEWGVRKWNRLL